MTPAQITASICVSIIVSTVLDVTVMVAGMGVAFLLATAIVGLSVLAMRYGPS